MSKVEVLPQELAKVSRVKRLALPDYRSIKDNIVKSIEAGSFAGPLTEVPRNGTGVLLILKVEADAPILSRRSCAANAVQLRLYELAHDPGRFRRILATPNPIKD